MAEAPPPEEPYSEQEFEPPTEESDNASLQLFHYHLPVGLEGAVVPGHLVWAPFGKRSVQGIVTRLTDSSPVPTKAILKLARPEPILSEMQLTLAAWIANYYVAPLSEAIKLFIPPGLLKKEETDPGTQVRRELIIELAVPAILAHERLETLARQTAPVQLLQSLISQPLASLPLEEIKRNLGTKAKTALTSLTERKVIEPQNGQVRLLLSAAEADDLLQELRGIAKFSRVVTFLATTSAPLWKSELYEHVATDLPTLRTLQSAGIIKLDERVRFRDPLRGQTYSQTYAPQFTLEQQAVWSQIERVWIQQGQLVPNARFLLHGVTGSGKTEIYLRSIAEALKMGRQAIVLVPEIALTPQTVARFAGRFPGQVTVIHSELSAGERYDVWRSIRNSEFNVVIGPRSALFAPMPRLGLIIIDEEHESSYKQNSEEWGSMTVFYDARTVARKMAELSGSLLIVGSATPSLESYAAVKQGTFALLEMPHRVMGHQPSAATSADSVTSVPIYAELPPVEIIDMRQELRAGHRAILSRTLIAELQATLDAGEQAILFLNRRGAFTFVLCRDCGHVEKCSRCDIPLVYHERSNELVCHHCNRHYPTPTICPQCKSKRIKFFGSGTERIEEVVQQLVPRARILRWDADTTTRKGSHADILRRFAGHEADILVGTQMIAKGLDLPLVTLVGVIAADTGLHLPDFRSAERAFQLLTQVAGRAGRSHRSGKVIIQTYSPQHYAIQAAAQHDYKSFFAREIGFRREHSYPPFRRIARLVYWEKNPLKAKEGAERMGAMLRHQLTTMGLEGQASSILGPAPAFFARSRGYYRWQLLLRSPDPALVLRQLSIPFGWRIDIDPVSVL